jgi:trimeric autotransporter adhesin
VTAESGIALSFTKGSAALTVARRELAAFARLERMEVEVPSLLPPQDGKPDEGPERARNRRGRLQAAVITVDEPGLRAALVPGLLEEVGITDLRLAFSEGCVHLAARATVQGREAEFTARALITPGTGRRLRLTIDDVRIYGFLPIAAPLLGAAILNASVVAAAGAGAGPAAGGRATAHWTVDIDALDLAVYEIFAAWGWRLPDISAARLGEVAVSPTGITLAWGTADTTGGRDAAEITGAGGPHPLAEADGLLARGDTAAALARYRAAARADGTNIGAARRVLELLLVNHETLGEATDQAAFLATLPDEIPRAALACAVIAAERGDAVLAAQTFAGIAAGATSRVETADATAARAAAARAWLRAGQPGEARPHLEAVVAAHPEDRRAAALLAEITAVAASMDPTAAPPLSTTQPGTALAVALAEAEHAEAANRPGDAAAALRRAIDLSKDARATADLARRLASVCDRQGDEEGALVALRTLLDHAEAGPLVAVAWQRLVELHARRGDPQAAARALIASADDPRTGSTDPERGAALAAAAEILRKRLRLPGDAVMLLERAIALDPRSIEALDALQTIAVESNNWERLADVLARKVDLGARGPVEQKELLVQLAEVHDRHLQSADRARDTHERALQIDPRFRTSLSWLARDAWVRGDAAAAMMLYGRLAAVEDADPSTPAETRVETHVRLGTLSRQAGDDGTAEREAERALAAVPAAPAALDLLIELLEAHARYGELADALARRAANDLGATARTDLLRRQAVALERAERPARAALVWRALVESDPGALPALRRLAAHVRASGDRAVLLAVLEPLGEALVSTGDLEAADQILQARSQLTSDPTMVGALATERARVRMLRPEGAAAALKVLRDVPHAMLPEEGLMLRADLGERQESLEDALAALEELVARARAGGRSLALQELEPRILEIKARLTPAAPATVEDLERQLGTDPTDTAAAEELAYVYAQIADPHLRSEALSGLLRRALGLTPDRRKTIYAALGESAEQSGDLERAEQAYWRAATIEAEPALRANYLVSHARVLLARGEVQTAISELEEAIARVPHHAGALALLADLTFRTRDWTRARQLYAELEAAPDAAEAIARETLVHRRAVLADAQGDSADAEAFYRELAILNPRHVEARRALADIALNRGDFGAAALRLEEVLRLMPLDVMDQVVGVRQRLGAVYVQLGDWGSARYFLELVLAQDPSRQPSLELLIEVYERLELYKEAAQSCARMSRLYLDRTRRAAALYRQGEILRTHLNDEAGAFEAFLKSSDVDPRFVPTMARLIHYYWLAGDFTALTGVAVDLDAAAFAPGDDLELAVELALGTAFGPGAGLATDSDTRFGLGGRPFDAGVAARALAQLAATRQDPPAALDLAMDTILDWAAAPEARDVAMAALEPALTEIVTHDPSDLGALRALGNLADRMDRPTVARAAYALLAFAAPSDATAARLGALGNAPEVSPEDLRVGGPAEHPQAGGALRRVLAALAKPLLALMDAVPTIRGASELSPPPAKTLRRLGERLAAPPVSPVVEPGDAVRIAVAGSAKGPVSLRISAAAAALPEAAWTFLAARALDDMRGGLPALRDLPAADRTEVLVGAQAALMGAKPESARARATAARVNEAGAGVPTGEARESLVADLAQVLSKPPNWESFLRAVPHTANRVALLACGSPSAALAQLAREDAQLAKVGAGAGAGAGNTGTSTEARLGFLRTSPVRELVSFMLSPAYARALAHE